ncbi:MAG: hypothetical protein ABI866_05035 [Dokdonella sp.]
MSFVVETVLTEFFERGAADEAVVDSITDEWVFFEGIGAGVGALLVLTTVSRGFAATTAGFCFAGAGLATFTFAPDFPAAAAAEGLAVARVFLAAAFLATGFLATGAFATAFFATVFFATIFFATGFLSTGLDLALEETAFTVTFPFGFGTGLARDAALPDLAAD